MRIIPAIDIIEGQCVRLSKGDYNTKKVYNNSPVEVAKMFEYNGIKYLHLVDLDGAKSKHIVNYKILEEIATKTNLIIDFGGGIKSDDDIRIAFESGADQITGGSIAVKDPNLFVNWIEQYGEDKIILGADVRDELISISGWTDQSDIHILDFIEQYLVHGIKYIICTDISKDGMLEGPSIDLYNKILSKCNINLIASGGVSRLEDLYELKALGCEGVIIGKAIYEGKIQLKEIQDLC